MNSTILRPGDLGLPRAKKVQRVGATYNFGRGVPTNVLPLRAWAHRTIVTVDIGSIWCLPAHINKVEVTTPILTTFYAQ